MAMLINPDPVYLDDRALYAALESDTDWDYLTDEYYDDDPTLKLCRRKEKAAARREKRESRQQAPIDRAMFCGVSWQVGPRAESNGPIYQPGDGEKVALLKNWREVFHESKPKGKKANDKLRSDGKKVRATFHSRLSTRPRRGKGKRDEDDEVGIDAGDEGDTDEMDTERNGLGPINCPPSTSLPLPPSKFGDNAQDDETNKPAKRGRGHPRTMRGGGSQLKEVTLATEEKNPAPGFEIMVPSAPADAAEYKEIPVHDKPKRGRKRKADSAAEQATPALADGLSASSGPVKKSKRNKGESANGASTPAPSRPTRSSTRRN
ncbi:uncharacterized protein GIQ15_06694 [Arthroderma uncinatum]|uniref:uncharacterized protein n=1 Tax=Arthroderma uncinatum TaxID=74035 RepID=UPI00144AE238|nr:uncharacterized protein GIQ15_06694 [Arthroderma uncinatum]KAF3479718.1 hypothetical protein GIQ15_06694 [Arthroderma uncinatum]